MVSTGLEEEEEQTQLEERETGWNFFKSEHLFKYDFIT